MKPSFSFIILASVFVAMVIMAIIGDVPAWSWFIPIGTGVFATLIVFRGSFIPQKAVEHGLELIKAQNYNNRLVKVGEANADRIVVLFNSLIDKLRAERIENREQESLLKLLIEASPLGVVMLDLNKKVSLVNSSVLKIFSEKSEKEIEGKYLSEITHDLIPEMLKVPVGQSRVVRKANFKIYRIHHLSFMKEGFTREFFLIESLTDEIHKAEKSAYEKVIRTISHEVNNTMGGVRSVLEIIAETTSDMDIKKVVESCEQRCETMGNFIREYAEIVKLPAPDRQIIDLGKEIESIFPFLERMVSESVKLNYHKKGADFFIKADSGLLQQVLLNIVKNAVESIESKGFINIDIEEKKDDVILTISNNGTPIEKNISDQLFTPFFTTKPNGKGIGLTFVREVLQNHGASYELKSHDDGVTRFKIIFPR